MAFIHLKEQEERHRPTVRVNIKPSDDKNNDYVIEFSK